MLIYHRRKNQLKCMNGNNEEMYNKIKQLEQRMDGMEQNIIEAVNGRLIKIDNVSKGNH